VLRSTGNCLYYYPSMIYYYYLTNVLNHPWCYLLSVASTCNMSQPCVFLFSSDPPVQQSKLRPCPPVRSRPVFPDRWPSSPLVATKRVPKRQMRPSHATRVVSCDEGESGRGRRRKGWDRKRPARLLNYELASCILTRSGLGGFSRPRSTVQVQGKEIDPSAACIWEAREGG